MKWGSNRSFSSHRVSSIKRSSAVIKRKKKEHSIICAGVVVLRSNRRHSHRTNTPKAYPTAARITPRRLVRRIVSERASTSGIELAIEDCVNGAVHPDLWDRKANGDMWRTTKV